MKSSFMKVASHGLTALQKIDSTTVVYMNIS